MGSPILKFAVIGDIKADNQWCMAGVSRITPMVKKLGASCVLAGDPDGWRIIKVKDDASFDLGKAMKTAFAEKQSPLELVEECGIPFLLCNTRELFDEDWVRFDENRKILLKKSDVFFYAQCYHPVGASLGYFMPKQDRGCMPAAFKGCANCIAFSSGALGPLADERAIRQGDFGFTSVATSSFRYASLLPGRDNSEMKAPLNRPGLVVSVFPDRVEFKRILFTTGEALGEDWKMPLKRYGTLSYECRENDAVAPEFSASAKLKIKLERSKIENGKEKDFVRLDFPRAKGKMRPFEYEVTVHSFEGDIDAIVTQRRMYSPGIFGPVSEEPGMVTFRIDKKELYYDVPLLYEVRPMNSFGKKGRPISVTRTIKADSPFKRG